MIPEVDASKSFEAGKNKAEFRSYKVSDFALSCSHVAEEDNSRFAIVRKTYKEMHEQQTFAYVKEQVSCCFYSSPFTF